MLFNSIDFAVFLPLVFGLYWLIGPKRLQMQNLFLIFASYLFYGWWDARFLLLIVFSSTLDYVLGLQLAKQEKVKTRKMLLALSVAINIGFLMYFKYFNFFLDSFSEAFKFFGHTISASRLNIILPVGISFYTFQTLSYTIDVYRKKLEPCKSWISFFAFVSFFPQLVAGPIERATNLIPQFNQVRSFDYKKSIDGLRQILWGLFKKIVIADNCATFVNSVYDTPLQHDGSTLFVASIFFTFQIYCDFSGYSDIAIGTSRLFGFRLMKNFAFPYFSRDIAEFWRRWHISLSTWFRDYLYIPLGGSRGSLHKTIRNVFIIFVVSGFWHGANWTFIFWGTLNALFIMPSIIFKKNRVNLNVVAENQSLPTTRETIQLLLTFLLAVFAWIFFRSSSLGNAFDVIGQIFSTSLFSLPMGVPYEIVILLIGFIVIEWIGRRNEFAIEKLGLTWNRLFRISFYYLIILLIFFFTGEKQEFIYFQF